MQANAYPINSRQWWEEYFARDWDATGGGDQTRHFMERLLAGLSAPETAFLQSKALSILDWGCAFGEGVELLTEAFPKSRVLGLDFASRAIEQARQRRPNREFILAESGEITDEFNVIVTSNCLEHFEYPLELVKTHLRSCRELYIALVPYNEFPLSAYHRSQFKEESFPERLGSFVRICVKTIDTDPVYWDGRQLLVIYGSQSYCRERINFEHEQLEQEKWDHYYASLPLFQPDAATQTLGTELVEQISALLPAGGRILEAGCGGGWQSLAVARSGRFQVSLMDFSREALRYAQRLFEREQLQAEFIKGDVFTHDKPQFDLVFNAGVLEHYALEEQAAFLRGMASRSRNYVMALVPNRLCYWYWLWRIQKSSRGEWPFGKEVPIADFSAAFEAAGLQFLGQTFMGEKWAESFVADFASVNQRLCDQILEVNHSPLIPKEHKSYLLAGLGSVLPETSAPASIWLPSVVREDMQTAELHAALADALALRIGAEQRLKQLEANAKSLLSELAEKKKETEALLSELAEKKEAMTSLSSRTEQQLSAKDYQLRLILNSRSWRLVMRYARLKHRYLIPPYRSLRALLGKIFHKHQIENKKKGLARSKVRFPDPQQLGLRASISSHTSLLGPSQKVDVVCFSIIDWDFRFQRPQQLMSRFAAAGHRVFYVSQNFHSGPAYTIKEKRKNIYEISLRGLERNVYADLLDDKARDVLFNSLDILRRDLSLGAAVSFVQLPFWRPLVNQARSQLAWPIVYDCMDHHGGFSTNGQTMLDQERDLLASADLVVVSSDFLERQARENNSNVLMVRNACDYDHFATVRKTQAARRVIGYHGAVADWFDSELVADLAESRPDWDFVIVGSTFSADISRLSKLSNVLLPGEQPYSKIPDWLAKFDVAIIPFKRIPLTEATNPVKAYEILATGKPLVSVPIPEAAALGPLVRLASTAQEFEREIAAALNENEPELITKRRAFAKQHTWKKRHEILAPAVFDAFPKVSIIVVTFSNLHLNRLCLESIYTRTEWPNFEVIVVDNGSDDGTPGYLKEAEDIFPNLHVVLNDTNLGFAAANNIGLKLATGDYLVLLNNDTLVTRGWVSALIRHLHLDPKIGLIGPVTNAIGNEARVEVDYARLEDMPFWAADYVREHDGELFPISMLAMFCVAMRREVFEEVGLLDERFGVGMFEDDDYSRRLQAAGYELRCASDSFVHHWQKASFHLLETEAYLSLFEENRRKFEQKWGEAWKGPFPFERERISLKKENTC